MRKAYLVNENEKYFLNSSHAALSSFQSSGRITADMRFAPRLGAHPNCSRWSQLLISANVVHKREIELEQLNEQIKLNDIRIFQFFRTCESDSKNNSELESLYNQFFDYDKEFDFKYEIYTKLSNDLNFINVTTPFEQIRANLTKAQETKKKLKNGIHELLEDSKYQTEITKEIKDNFDLFLSKEWKYFGNEKYFDSNLEILFTAMNNYAILLSRGYFLLKKKLLNYQVELIKTTHNIV